MHLNFHEVQKIKNQLYRVSHTVVFNPDGSFTCRRRYEQVWSSEQFSIDIRRIMMAAQRGKIEILENTIERKAPGVMDFVVKFKPLR